SLFSHYEKKNLVALVEVAMTYHPYDDAERGAETRQEVFSLNGGRRCVHQSPRLGIRCNLRSGDRMWRLWRPGRPLRLRWVRCYIEVDHFQIVCEHAASMWDTDVMQPLCWYHLTQYDSRDHVDHRGGYWRFLWRKLREANR